MFAQYSHTTWLGGLVQCTLTVNGSADPQSMSVKNAALSNDTIPLPPCPFQGFGFVGLTKLHSFPSRISDGSFGSLPATQRLPGQRTPWQVKARRLCNLPGHPIVVTDAGLVRNLLDQLCALDAQLCLQLSAADLARTLMGAIRRQG
eukprot:358132-Chlamydomonas_euryale.AAC.4